MRIVVHDYSGHPFQVQLSRELARLGHEVVHQYCSSYVSGKGAVTLLPGDPEGFTVEEVPMSSEFARYSPLRRVVQEFRFGLELGDLLRRRRPDAVVMCNIPLLAHWVAAARLSAANVPMLFWQQDVYSHAIGMHARRVLGPVVGRAVSLLADRAERWVARHSAHTVAIAEEFRPVLTRWGVPEQRVTVIPNWAAVNEVPVCPRDNSWARKHGLVDRLVVGYTGTMGLKHHPGVFTHLAQVLATSHPQARIVVLSEGRGREWLEQERRRLALDNLVLLDFQPYDDLPLVLASMDLLVCVLEPDASRYSVPSKVLNYLCAGRPVLGVMPAGNAAARTLTTSGAGLVVPGGDVAAASAAVLALLDEPARRTAMGHAGRAHAEQNFSILPLAQRFEALLQSISRDPVADEAPFPAVPPAPPFDKPAHTSAQALGPAARGRTAS